MTKAEFIERYGEQAYEKRKAYKREWAKAHPEYQRDYYRRNRERMCAYQRGYQSKHRSEQRERMNAYHETKEGRATNLLAAYVQMDLERRGVRPRLTQADILRKCFDDGCKCMYCGETDWHLLGLDRIDNDKPHDAENCICSCVRCNTKRYRKSLGDWIGVLGLSPRTWMDQNNATFAEPMLIKVIE